MTVDDTGSSTIMLLLTARTCSEGAEDDTDSCIKYLYDSGGPSAASIKASGGGDWDEWVASHSPKFMTTLNMLLTVLWTIHSVLLPCCFH